MTGFFMKNDCGRLEVQCIDDGETREVMIDIRNDDDPDEPWISISDPEELEELIEYLNQCKEKLKFFKQ